MGELDHKESWALKNWCFWTMVLEKTLESPLYCKEIQSVNPKGIQSFWMFIGRTDTEAPILWPPDVKNWLIRKDPDVEKNWRRGRRGQQRIKWLDRIYGYEFEQTLGDSKVQGSLTFCSPCGHKETDMTEFLNWDARLLYIFCLGLIA